MNLLKHRNALHDRNSTFQIKSKHFTHLESENKQENETSMKRVNYFQTKKSRSYALKSLSLHSPVCGLCENELKTNDPNDFMSVLYEFSVLPLLIARRSRNFSLQLTNVKEMKGEAEIIEVWRTQCINRVHCPFNQFEVVIIELGKY